MIFRLRTLWAWPWAFLALNLLTGLRINTMSLDFKSASQCIDSSLQFVFISLQNGKVDSCMIDNDNEWSLTILTNNLKIISLDMKGASLNAVYMPPAIFWFTVSFHKHTNPLMSLQSKPPSSGTINRHFILSYLFWPVFVESCNLRDITENVGSQ